MGNFLYSILKITFAIAFWPVTLLIFISKCKKESKRKKSGNISLSFEEGCKADIARMNRDLAFDNTKIREKQFEETMEAIEDSTRITSVLSKFKYLKSLLEYVNDDIERYPCKELRDIKDRISDALENEDEYVHTAILRIYSKADVDCQGLTNAQKRTKYLSVYRQFDKVKNRFHEENISLYTSLALYRLEVDTTALPAYSELLSRLNFSSSSRAIPSEYYDFAYDTFRQSVQDMIKLGFLEFSEDGKAFILTEKGLKQTGWQRK